ncbi:transmembrane protein 45B-like [Phalaenopsis equestris]|uniref:transmembrane protein 45B-like n=1 Tax=Phalaenopsis equestris TaxID=78828 RepID=UPI0009E2F32A|nr:transmembrane protein 45B-like [Phalaenopsis equestris]
MRAMGTLVGHVAPGLGFLLIGIWHLYNNIKLFSLHPNTYRSLPWFPAPKLRRLELLLIAIGSSVSIAMELFIGPARHQPFDPDFTIPSYHLHNFEHASISLSFLIYAVFATALDHRAGRPAARQALTVLAAAAAFGQQFLLFRLHSADHEGVEGQYHWLLQLVVGVSFATTLMGISHPCSFPVAFVRSNSITLQGLWFILMGYALWTPKLIPKGCFMNAEDGHYVVRCRSDDELRRAKSLVNIEFSWLFATVVAFSLLCYLLLSKKFEKVSEYDAIEEEELENLELGKMTDSKLQESDSFAHMERVMRSIELER